ncbi:hypothetical protein KKD52_05800 [Myxococcota bacterium]|jgi:hypothetical protein|nr:hypothetical protein [Myxococcota bacterium]MBU1410442.1 hypothetical protein [Myxococcota bacterium]MBU1509855.1 hypothetical protein [Myxococcota bacterium]PKN26899.1 MAG: hypothetical protein CVU65_04200 [Deltaproteobacteria bacterium HGW-Deltaproteobacteria-22]
MKHALSFILLLALVAPGTAAANNGRYQRGNAVYKEKLTECAMWWYRLGDITKSSGTRINTGDLALELGRLDEAQIRQWLADPMSIGPRVNCRPGPFTTERQVMDLIHYLQRRATNPVVIPVITHEPMKRTTIRLLRSQSILRERLRVREEIRRMNGTGGTPEKPRTTAPRPVVRGPVEGVR